MPLRDHFRDGQRGIRKWKSIHTQWATQITETLNTGVLPAGFVALPTVQLGVAAQVDVGTWQEGAEGARAEGGNGAVATAVWAPPRPTVVVACDLADLDVAEVQLFDEQGSRLVAAVELVSPANKDRPTSRRAFAAKCAAYLQQEVSVIVIDVVSERRDSLHAALMELLGLEGEPATALAAELYAVAYRSRGRGEAPRLEMWPHALSVGGAMPVLPLWIGPDLAVPLDLEATYAATCKALRMPP